MFARSVLSSYYRLLTGALLAFAVFALTGCNEKVAEKTEPGRPVLVATVHYEAETPERSFVGTIKPRIEADMGFRVAGKVAKRLVEVGQTVDIDQPLATLDEVDLKLQAEQAEAEQRASTGVLAQAAAAEQRAKDLKAKGWATDATLDSAKAAADEARARLNRAERSVELTKNSLSYATLVADTRGVVTATMIEPGQVVAAGQASIRVARLGEKEAVVAIPETLLSRARSGVATVTLWSDANKTYAAKLREVAPSADPATRTYLAKFSLPDADDNVSLGMTATLTLADSSTERVAKLPLSALYSQGGDPSLYIVDDKGDIALKPVKVKSYGSDCVVISGGVDDGAKVVALGVQKLDPSQKVRVVSSLSF
ncbi:efflux RND transporter periplasmic adaptor subunit [Bradyrhizobium jicamae]|uniref:Efflux RND transporter periplasmic adaptor subunit n=1 Tax=Bradyrhizobium jicamae TaxID=280332 RepID=A0ABS5FFE9_9BRAD|nr:efflux RND transporter periplasmic adaptor subunit [Bradyrhizobium jicamae]MBR0795506.1 efflux RND transporter periplasmic adaptor subunit [Bradyrhizobium jicamae]MBR0932545.1 efflux RND transporter periplasmic adaptor subunit [Bradyrhizobium jicamae]